MERQLERHRPPFVRHEPISRVGRAKDAERRALESSMMVRRLFGGERDPRTAALLRRRSESLRGESPRIPHRGRRNPPKLVR